jgi:ATP-binding cassette, subfamily B, bacterial
MNTAKYVLKTVALSWTAAPHLFFAVTALTIFGGGLPFLIIYINSRLLNLLAAGASSGEFDTKELMRSTLAVGLASLLGYITTQLTEFYRAIFQRKITNSIQTHIIDKSIIMDHGMYDDPEFYNSLQNANTESAHRPFSMINSIMQGLSASISIIFMVIAVISWNPLMALTAILPSILALRASNRISISDYRHFTEKTAEERRAAYYKSIATGDQSSKDLRVMQYGLAIRQRLQDVLSALYFREKGRLLSNLESRSLSGVLSSLSFPAAVGIGILQVVAGDMSFFQFSLYSQSFNALGTNASRIFIAVAQLREGSLFLSNLWKIMALPDQLENRVGTVSHGISGTCLEVKEVSFTYLGSSVPTIQQINFTASPGEVIAIAGSNGSGKSTLLKLIAGLYKCNSGSIRIGGVDILDMSSAVYRSKLACVFQDFPVYHMSVRENVSIGSGTFDADEAVIQESLRISGLTSVVDKLPNGSDTILGRYFDRGSELSGGERQILAVARALTKQASILLLDEPTSALDPQTEEFLLDRIIKKGRESNQIIILVSHKSAAVKKADRIIFMSNGKVQSAGSHDELVNAGGMYQQMFAPVASYANDVKCQCD